MLESMSLDPGAQRGKCFFENILRWEDDGGPVLETDNPLQARETKTPWLQDASGERLL
jgi:hypothetical protein